MVPGGASHVFKGSAAAKNAPQRLLDPRHDAEFFLAEQLRRFVSATPH